MIPHLALSVGMILLAAAPGAGDAGAAGDPREKLSTDSLLILLGDEPGSPGLRDLAQRDPRRSAREAAAGHEAIRIGEKLTFSVRYGMIRAGEATMEVADTTSAFGHPCYHVVSRARSNSVFDTIYKVRDVVETWMDRERLFSRRFRKSLREGSYRATQDVEMDQENGFARYQDGRVFELVRGAHDVLSGFYYVRTLDLEVGQEIWLESHADRKNYPLKVLVMGRERIDSPVGEFDCLKLEPMLRTPGLFKHEGKLTIWLTDDERKMPILMKSKVPVVGSISVVLTSYERPR